MLGELAEKIEQAIRTFREKWMIPATKILGGVSTLTYGLILFLDDIRDFGKFDRIHHWHIGLLLALGGVGALLWAIKDTLEQLGLAEKE